VLRGGDALSLPAISLLVREAVPPSPTGAAAARGRGGGSSARTAVLRRRRPTPAVA
jgi:hypothetical protein